VTDDLVTTLGQYSTATLSDALDRLGRPGSMLGIAPLTNEVRLAGRAYTVRYQASGFPSGTVGDYLDDVAPGRIVVLDNQGRTDCTVWGDILTAMAHDRRVGGTVIDGVCRDTERALGNGYPLFTRGRFMRTGKDRVEVAEVGGTVTIGGVHVEAGEILVGDSDGVVGIPRDIEARVAEVAAEIHERESRIIELVLGGMSIAQARAEQGYHLLQRKE
jgi:regulator of RNase E activity RraA